MSVRAWKRVITITVILIIAALITTTIVYNGKYKKEINKQLPETMIDLADYGMTDIEEKGKYEDLFRFFADKEKNGAPKYQTKYKKLYVDNPFEYEDLSGSKICYLTFEDSPDLYTTGTILDTLKKYNVKATFFVTYKPGEANENLLRRMIEEGHTIGVYSSGSDYKTMYKSVTSYLREFKKVSDWIEDTTGVKPEIFRFRGGSVNIYNVKIYNNIITEMIRRGYTYYDWNCNSGDAAASWITADDIKANVIKESGEDKEIVRMHDGQKHWATVNAIGPVIEALSDDGYEFRALDKTVEPVRFDY